ncbi:aldo/keto reductase [Glaciimonas sp. CA11.2]|uniref:aldo/keto reductase n=1 Tax=Glaciimonas sp. CA11.2 TaxID=3048601 RepID=UPI002AB40259|nr:aldo/keto reductase [Glaciimonas sp. CA11.2]MDY7545356.1 aldo/keto reductase [Glaciimonas sp. CA11.2]
MKPFKRVGMSGLKLSQITFGSALTIGTEDSGKAFAQMMIDGAWDLGIRSFDTSNNYGMGMAETLLGHALKKYPREEFVLATKGSWPIGSHTYHQGLGRKHILWAFDESMKRLGMEYVDVYYAHRYDPETPMEEVVRTFNRLINSGRILYWATSEWPLAALVECHEVCNRLGLEKPILDQFIYSYAINKADINGVRAFCQAEGVGMLGFAPLAQGLLTGKYRESIPPESRIAKSGQLGYDKTQKIYEQNKARIDHFSRVCVEHEVKGSHAAIQWVLRRGVLPVLGASSPTQLKENVGALDSEIPDDFWVEVDAFEVDKI